MPPSGYFRVDEPSIIEHDYIYIEKTPKSNHDDSQLADVEDTPDNRESLEETVQKIGASQDVKKALKWDDLYTQHKENNKNFVQQPPIPGPQQPFNYFHSPTPNFMGPMAMQASPLPANLIFTTPDGQIVTYTPQIMPKSHPREDVSVQTNTEESHDERSNTEFDTYDMNHRQHGAPHMHSESDHNRSEYERYHQDADVIQPYGHHRHALDSHDNYSRLNELYKRRRIGK